MVLRERGFRYANLKCLLGGGCCARGLQEHSLPLAADRQRLSRVYYTLSGKYTEPTGSLLNVANICWQVRENLKLFHGLDSVKGSSIRRFWGQTQRILKAYRE